MTTNISIILDNRKIRKDNTYPVKLRVYSQQLQRAKLYSVNKNMTEETFKDVWQTEKPKKKFQSERDFLDAVRVKALEAAHRTEPFSFDLFEKKMHRKKGDAKNVVYHYNQKIKELKELGNIGTAETYNMSLKSIKKFIESQTRKEPESIPFISISSSFLQKYENYMLSRGKSTTTISMYLRALRAIFNAAIRDNELTQDIYPFGKGKYEIPAGRAVKKALTKPQLKTLLDANPLTPEQEKAKDFWLFSFICNGMNINDIALLKYGNIVGDTIEFKRAKTLQTSKKNSKTIVVHLTDFANNVIDKYGNEDRSADQFIFPIIVKNITPEEAKQKIKNFTRFINQHIKLMAKAIDLPEEISTYWARHTFATHVIRGGANMEFVKEAFGHQNITTTQNYFAGFEDEAKKKIVENLLKFD